MAGTKVLEVTEAFLAEVVNYYVSREMPKLGVCTGVHVSVHGPATFQIELEDRTSESMASMTRTFQPADDGLDLNHGPTVHVMRQEGKK